VYLGSAARVAGADSFAANPQPVWRTSVARGIYGAPALSDDVIALALADHRVALLNRATGDILWRRRLGQAIGAGPLISDDRIFVAEQTAGGHGVALRLDNGKTIWSADAGDVVAPLALADHALYAATAEGLVGRLDPDRGGWVWRTRLRGAVRAAPLVTRAGLVIATDTDSLYLLDRATGAVRVRRGVRGAVLAAPAFGDSLLVLGTMAGRVEALDAATLETRWNLEFDDPIVGSIAVRRDTAYALTGRGLLAIVPLAHPDAARRVVTGVVTRAGPTPTARGVLVGGVNGEIVLVDGAGTHRWSARIEPPVSEPVIVDAHTLVAVSLRGDVVMYR